MRKNVYLFYGDEPLIIKNKINHIVKDVKTTDHNISTYDLDETNILNVLQDASMPPFLADNKVIIVKNPRFLESSDILDEAQTALLKRYLNNPNELTVLIFDGSNIKVSKNSAIMKLFLKTTETSHTQALTDVEKSGWLRRQLQANGITIKEDAVKLFFNLVDKDLFAAQNEINKIINYVGNGGTVTTHIIHEVVTKELEKDVFALTNSIIAREKEKVIDRYQQLIKDGNNPNYLLSLISKSIRELLIVQAMLEEGYKQSDIAKVLGFSSGRAYYAVRNAKSLEPQIVKNYVYRLGDLDYKIKSGQIDINTGLEFLILGL